MSTRADVQKVARWVCVEISVRDLSAMPGQSTLMPIAVIARKGTKDARHLPLAGAEWNPNQVTLNDMVRASVNSDSVKGLFEYLYYTGIGGYSSCSEEFLIEASNWDELLDQLRQRGFPASKEL
jgi:hypothetical protein